MEIKNFIEGLKPTYDNAYGDNLGKDFYSPCLENCKQYKRMTGEFRSSVIFDWGKALLKILDNEDDKCIVKIIANPSLNAFDAEALKKTIEIKDDNFWNQIGDKIYEDAKSLVNKDLEKQDERDIKLKIFSYLIAKKKLILKFGFPRHIENPGMFHWKKGIFYFDEGLKVGFNGGPNESHGGHERNIEGIDVFTNIKGENIHINDFEYKFDLAWNDKAPGFQTKPLSKKTLDKISLEAPKSKKEIQNIIKKALETKRDTLGDLLDEEQIKKLKQINTIQVNEEKENYLEVKNEKWRFQQEAREAFIQSKWGLLEMATGTGKTRTALSIATQLINEKKINKIILQMYGSDLIKQWHGNVNKWIFSKLEREVNLLDDENEDMDFFLMNYKNDNVDFIIVRQSRLPKLLDQINEFDQSKTLIIHDEVHDLFAEKISEQIIGKQNKFGYKLGLSATIREKYNKRREKLLFDEIQGGGSEPVFKYDLEQAIKNGILVEMDLVHYEYELYEDEVAKIQQAYTQHKSDLEEGMPKWKADEKRNTRIADVRKNARNKIEVFEEKINEILPFLNRSFIFADESDYGDRLLNILAHKINVRTHYGNNDKDNLARFSKGEINCIINVMKLSQGIDVQSLNSIILFATPKERQFKQRLGRVLRSDPNNLEKKATVVDFFDKKHMDENKGSDYNRYLELLNYSKIKKEINEH